MIGRQPASASQLTAENRPVEVGGDTLVYRRFGNTQTDAVPLLCLQHFRGNLDFWDPALVDRIVQDREVILLATHPPTWPPAMPNWQSSPPGASPMPRPFAALRA